MEFGFGWLGTDMFCARDWIVGWNSTAALAERAGSDLFDHRSAFRHCRAGAGSLGLELQSQRETDRLTPKGGAVTEESRNAFPELTPDDKLTPLMIYTNQSLIVGQALSKQAIRVSTWLRTDMAPKYLQIWEAQVLLLMGGQPKTMKHNILHVQVDQILAYHIKPPDKDPPDYDPNEPNRRMAPTLALVGPFQFMGHTRISTQSELSSYLAAAKGAFLPLYDAEMSCPKSLSGVTM